MKLAPPVLGVFSRDVRPRDGPIAPVHHPCMPALPESFRAYVVDKPEGGAFVRGLRTLTPADLPPGEVTIRVEWSGVNFKDGLAARADGRVARSYPLVPGIDLAGIGGGLRRRRVSGRDGRPGERLRHRHRAPRRVRRAGTDPGGLGRAAAGRSDGAGRDGHRHRGVHRRDERPGTRGSRPPTRRRARARDRCVGRRGLHGRRDPGVPRPRGLGRDRQDRRGSAPVGPRRGGDPHPRGGHGRRAAPWTPRAGRAPWTRSARRRCPTSSGPSGSARPWRRPATRAARSS